MERKNWKTWAMYSTSQMIIELWEEFEWEKKVLFLWLAMLRLEKAANHWARSNTETRKREEYSRNCGAFHRIFVTPPKGRDWESLLLPLWLGNSLYHLNSTGFGTENWEPIKLAECWQVKLLPGPQEKCAWVWQRSSLLGDLSHYLEAEKSHHTSNMNVSILPTLVPNLGLVQINLD